jgi:hypothetical protein
MTKVDKAALAEDVQIVKRSLERLTRGLEKHARTFVTTADTIEGLVDAYLKPLEERIERLAAAHPVP